MVNVIMIFLLVFSVFMIFINHKKSKENILLEDKNKKLMMEISKISSDNKKITLEYLALKEIWVRLERQASEVMSKMGKHSVNLDYADLLNSEKVTNNVNYDVDDILDEIREKGRENVSKDKIDFLIKNSK